MAIPAIPPAALPADEPEFRAFGDPATTRAAIYDTALETARTLPPRVGRTHTLKLTDVDYADKGEYTLAQQKEALLGGQTLGRRLRGTWRLYDNQTGDEIDSKAQTVARIPYYTPRGTFIHNGTAYSLSNQMRLRPGIFTRIQDNGDVEAHVNVRSHEGPSFRIFLDPKKGMFHARIQQAKIPLMPLLRAMGATDKDLREAWGGELLAANYPADNPANLGKFYQRLVRGGDAKALPEDKIAGIKEVLAKIKLDSEVTRRTLGTPTEQIDLPTVLATTKKLLALSKGEVDPDDRDSLAFQTLYGAEDLIAERLKLDAGRHQRDLLRKASFDRSLQRIPPGALNRQIESVILGSGLAQALEEVNPGEILDQQTRVTRMGMGGIPSIDSIPDDARSVQPSHLQFIDPLRTPESLKVGVDLQLSRAARKGKDGKIYAPFIDARTGKTVYRSPQDVADLSIMFPGEERKGFPRVASLQGGRFRMAKPDEVDLVPKHFENAFSPLSNLVPMKSAIQQQRGLMGARMLTQSLPLRNAEAPLVQSGMPDEDKSFEEYYGETMGAIRSPVKGQVVSVKPDEITVLGADGQKHKIELYNHFLLNRKTNIHNTPIVKSGDIIDEGGLLAKSNYTDDKGTTAIGLNARVAYTSFRGNNYEDAISISKSMADRLTSVHAYQHDADWGKGTKKGKAPFVAIFGDKYKKEMLDTLDEDGVVKEGTRVGYDHPLVLLAQGKVAAKNKIHKRKSRDYSDATIKWEHQSPGIVTDVRKTNKGAVVVVEAERPMEVGDKLSNRYGGKGVIGEIIDDDEMPRDSQGRPFEVLLNPLGIISRRNPAQMFETALGKIAERTGKPYKIKDFEDIEDLWQFTKDELDRNGMTLTEAMEDPETGKKIPGVASGTQFFMKLHHLAEDKIQGRSLGSYTQEGAPAKSIDGGDSSKRLSLPETNALLSHGATAVLRDAASVRGQKNEDYWMAFMQGHKPPKPHVPMVYRKFINDLRAAGINVVGDAGSLNIMAMTDKDVDELAGDRELTSGATVGGGAKLEPIAGGLFDPKLTGGHHGGRWSAVKLVEPMPNPVMVEPIKKILGLTEKKFEAILAGREEFAGTTGPRAISAGLNSVNLDREIELAREAIRSGKKTHRDIAVRRLGYLKAAKKAGIHPRDWMMTRVPVLPPEFRPVSMMGDQEIPLVADANYLYKELIDANNNLRELSEITSDVGDERLALYRSYKAVTGLGDPVHPKLVQKNVKGLLKHIFGSSPKLGTMQRKLLSKPLDLVGRAVITPDSELDMDSIGLPEEKAWSVYRNFVARNLHRKGMPVKQALNEIEKRSDLARHALVSEMDQRPLIVSRAPTLHRFGILAFRPKITKGDTLRISPLVVAGFNADFDGDQENFSVPADDEAVKEAYERMLPSRNLLSPADMRSPMHKPGQEYVTGLFHGTSAVNTKRPVEEFDTIESALRAYNRGEISHDQRVRILRS